MAPDHADRLPHDERVARPSCSQVKSVGHLAPWKRTNRWADPPAPAGTGPGHAHLVGDEIGQVFHSGTEGLAHLGQDGGALGHRPGRPAGKAARAAATARSMSSGVPSGTGADDLLGGRVDHLDGAGPGRGHPGPSDVERVADLLLHGWHGAPPPGTPPTLGISGLSMSGRSTTTGRSGRSTTAPGRPAACCITLPIYVGCDVRRRRRSRGNVSQTQQERKAETRARLLAAAAELFADQGIDAVSVDAVAEAAGRTSGAVYAHFGSKQGLLLALLDSWKDSVLARAAGRGGGHRLAPPASWRRCGTTWPDDRRRDIGPVVAARARTVAAGRPRPRGGRAVPDP